MRTQPPTTTSRARDVLAMSGDRSAFGQLVAEQQGGVRSFLRRLCRGDADSADDLAQNTFEKAWRKRASFRGDGDVRSWLMQIAFNEFRQHLRKYPASREAVAIDASEEADRVLSAQDPRTEDLDRLLGELTAPERAAMVLSYGHGYSHREIAEALGQPIGTVKSLIHRSKDRIRQRFRISRTPPPTTIPTRLPDATQTARREIAIGERRCE